jgi:hypothetical protein
LQRFHPRNLLLGHCTSIEATCRLRDLLQLDRRMAIVSAVGPSFELKKASRRATSQPENAVNARAWQPRP